MFYIKIVYLYLYHTKQLNNMEKLNKILDNAISSLKSLRTDQPSGENTVEYTKHGVDMEVLFDEGEGYCYVEKIYIGGVECTELLCFNATLIEELEAERYDELQVDPNDDYTPNDL